MKKKVLLLTGTVSRYRREVYEELAKRMSLTVGYTEKNEITESVNFEIVRIGTWKVKTLIIPKLGFKKFCDQFEVIIFVADLHQIGYCTLPFRCRKFKVIPWTIGIRASYSRPYDLTRKKTFADHIYGRILSKADAVIFYMPLPIKFWKGIVDSAKIFVAHNTVPITPFERNAMVEDKGKILFLGTLYREKGVDKLLKAFASAKLSNSRLPDLEVAGDGPERKYLEDYATQLGIEASVHFLGSVYDEKKIRDLHFRAIACISPEQAGLSVLKSMGYGVPYITKRTAITGGELFNIENNVTGMIFNRDEDLEKILLDIGSNKKKYLEMGSRARKFYEENATTEKMAEGVFSAIKFVDK